MIESVRFTNYKALRDATLPLGPFTLLVGPNGSGKTTALECVCHLERSAKQKRPQLATAGVAEDEPVSVVVQWDEAFERSRTEVTWEPPSNPGAITHVTPDGRAVSGKLGERLTKHLSAARDFHFSTDLMGKPVGIAPVLQLTPNGSNLAQVLDQLRDQAPERYEALVDELCSWLPEFSGLRFETPGQGQRSLSLRLRSGGDTIPMADLSHGTLLALGMLALAHSPEPPPIVGIEDPDRGLHPRLLRDVRNALYRLSHPEASGAERDPVQVIATTHSPYLLDLFGEHPEDVVLAKKEGLDATFERLSEQENLEDILRDSQLGEVWYSGVLGGVPSSPA